jgi:HD-GYP domain-containing protein (c-di-GMP phosphodiesterase class II)
MSTDDSYPHKDALAFLNESGSLQQRLVAAHAAARKQLPFVARIAVALYDPETSVLSAFLHSSGSDDNPLDHYEALLAQAPSLRHILDRGQPRVINNMLTFEDDAHEHTQRIGRAGYAASYTMPIFNAGAFLGFLFFNSFDKEVFNEKALQTLDLFGHLIALMVVNELSSVMTLSAALKSTRRITHLRDPETGSHLDRMSRYSRVIARALATRHDLEDDYIEHVFMFAPLHDIGKIAIPDSILLKRGALTDGEMQVMQTHVAKGAQIIDDLLADFGLSQVDHVDILRNIAACHHEAVNGSGYPDGRGGEGIPLEARIVAVADVFDALTSKRPYKEAWSTDDAFEMLQSMAGEKLDMECVQALLEHREEVEDIKRCFEENPYG